MIKWIVKESITEDIEKIIGEFCDNTQADKFCRKESVWNPHLLYLYKINRTGEHYEQTYFAGRIINC